VGNIGPLLNNQPLSLHLEASASASRINETVSYSAELVKHLVKNNKQQQILHPILSYKLAKSQAL